MIEKILERLEENTLNRESVIFFNSCGIEFISVNKAKEIVQEVAKEYGKDTNVRSKEYEKGYEDGYEEGAESVRALAPYEDGWIPCIEKLPALHDNVLVCTIDGGRTIAYLRMKRNHILSERIFEDMYGTPIHEVIAWQPLPKAYQMGE